MDIGIILGIISVAIGVWSLLNKEKIKMFFKKLKNKKMENCNNDSSEIEKVSILIELKESAKFYRAINTNNSYLSLNVMLVNIGNGIIIIRGIEAIMSDEIGLFQQKKVVVIATHKGNRANYYLGNTENLLPLSLTGNSSKDAYLLFEFPNASIEIGNVKLKVVSSIGDMLIPLSVEIIG